MRSAELQSLRPDIGGAHMAARGMARKLGRTCYVHGTYAGYMIDTAHPSIHCRHLHVTPGGAITEEREQ